MEKFLTLKRKNDQTLGQSNEDEDSSDGDSASPSSIQKKSAAKTRKYDDSYIEYGFIDNSGAPQYVICLATLSNDSMSCRA